MKQIQWVWAWGGGEVSSPLVNKRKKMEPLTCSQSSLWGLHWFCLNAPALSCVDCDFPAHFAAPSGLGKLLRNESQSFIHQTFRQGKSVNCNELMLKWRFTCQILFYIFYLYYIIQLSGLPCKVDVIFMPVYQCLREGKWFVQGHTSWNVTLNLTLFITRLNSF